MEPCDRKSTNRRSSTESTCSISSAVVLTGPSSLVPQISINFEQPHDDVTSKKRISGGVEVLPGNQLGVPRDSKADGDQGALSDSEIGRKKTNSVKSMTVGHRAGTRIGLRMPSNEWERDISESLESENQPIRVNSAPKTPLRMSDSLACSTSPKKRFISKRPTRRISCKDLGDGQCQGWLMKRKEPKILATVTWSMRWCVLHNKNLYYYKTAEWDVAEGVIHLPSFKVSPAPEIKNKKFAFKAHNPGMTIFFATERQDDMAKWMNKLALASLGDILLDLNKTTSFLKPELRQVKSSSHLDLRRAVETNSQITTPYSESEESTNESTEDLTDLYRNIRQANLDLAGTNRTERRSTIFLTDSQRDELLDTTSFEQDRLTRKLLSLTRTLKDKEELLASVMRFIEQSEMVTPESLHAFVKRHPHVSPTVAGLSAADSVDAAAASVDSPSSSSTTTTLTLPETCEEEGHQVQMR